MNTVFALIIVLAAAGRGAAKNGKIFDGESAKQSDFPYMAALKNAKGLLICGGAILNSRWVLSAAQCDWPSTSSAITYVGVGNVNLKKQTNYGVDFTVPFPEFIRTNRLGNILLVRTNAIIEMSPGVVSLISMNTNARDDLQSMSSMKVSGWGLSNAPNNYSLMATSYSSQRQDYCWRKNNEGNIAMPYSPEINLCAIASTSTPFSPNGLCCGDGGGPLVYNGLIYGVASRLMNNRCASNFPDVFTRISYYSSWVNSVINGNTITQ